MADTNGDVDLASPNAARMYDYYLGGASNFEIDRDAAERMLSGVPVARTWARANRAFLGRVVRFLASAGIDQFLDLGSGIPTVGNVHEVAHEVNPDARVAYVDREPVAVEHARQLLDGNERVTMTQGDIRHPDEVLAAPGVAGLLDFTRPVAVLAVAILHFVADDPMPIISGYRDSCVSGSYLVVSHLSRVSVSDEEMSHGHSVYNRTSTPATFRSKQEIGALLSGYTLVDPGVTLLAQWRPETPVSDEEAASTNGYAAAGVLP